MRVSVFVFVKGGDINRVRVKYKLSVYYFFF